MQDPAQDLEMLVTKKCYIPKVASSIYVYIREKQMASNLAINILIDILIDTVYALDETDFEKLRDFLKYKLSTTTEET